MMRNLIAFTLMLLMVIGVNAENGHQLWLRFDRLEVESPVFSGINADKSRFAVKEFQQIWKEKTGKLLPVASGQIDNQLIVGTLKDKNILSLGIDKELVRQGKEGYVIKTISKQNKTFTVVASADEKGLLYGVYHLLRILQTGEFSKALNISEKPSYSVRVLNHWDNLDGTIERGYAGRSIFWRYSEEHPTTTDKDISLWKEYARANASIGINGSVLNNVNASPKMLSEEYLLKVKAIASELRPYNIKVYLAINFSSPTNLGGLKTSDPLNPEVKMWWAKKVNEIYRLIPDFGGFLVKANSEGLPGPQDFGRTHADGANMLADALKPHGGIVMWRAFVYDAGKDDRAKLAYKEFMPLDGQFRDNVVIQVKNGPIDFQPREPFSPLFGAMKKTPLMPEVQITQEYLGFSNHLVFLSTMWEEFLESDTYCNGKGSTVAKTTDGTIFKQKLTAIAGVANIGLDANWCGHHFAQANWYAFGRLAWNNSLTSAKIADEWIKQTFSTDAKFVEPVKSMMLESREATVNYMMPLGLHHLFAYGHHYGPEPWCDVAGARQDWMPKYYHNASVKGIGFDRSTTGSNAVLQYFSPLKEDFNDANTCPDKYILWFHFLPWDFKMKSGRILWDELCYTYDKGVQQTREFQKTWDKAERFVDPERFTQVQNRLRIQAHDAVWWKDACLLYFQQFSKRPIPYDIERPVYKLDDLMKIKLDLTYHN